MNESMYQNAMFHCGFALSTLTLGQDGVLYICTSIHPVCFSCSFFNSHCWIAETKQKPEQSNQSKRNLHWFLQVPANQPCYLDVNKVKGQILNKISKISLVLNMREKKAALGCCIMKPQATVNNSKSGNWSSQAWSSFQWHQTHFSVLVSHDSSRCFPNKTQVQKSDWSFCRQALRAVATVSSS